MDFIVKIEMKSEQDIGFFESQVQDVIDLKGEGKVKFSKVCSDGRKSEYAMHNYDEVPGGFLVAFLSMLGIILGQGCTISTEKVRTNKGEQ